MKTTARTLIAAVLGTMLASAPAWGQGDPIGEARQLMERKDAQAAYRLLKPLEQARAGEPAFDYLLGIAALDAGRYTEAIFALERVLAVDPAHVQARAEIGRAYFLIGENEAAQRELQAVRSRGVPPAVAGNIDRFLNAIEQARAGERTRVSAFLEATLGHDSNVNSGIANGQVAVPAFGGAVVQLNPGGTKVSDEFLALSGGVNVRHPLRPDLALVAGLALSQRWNSSADQFDTGYVDGNVGLVYAADRHTFTAALQGNHFRLDDSRNREVLGGVGQWQYMIDRRTQVSAYLQATRVDYPGQEIRNVDRRVGGAGIAHAYGPDGPVAYAGLYFGEEKERAANAAHIGNDLWGLRIGGQVALKPAWTMFASVAYEHRDHNGEDAFFQTTRKDKQTTVNVGAHWTPARNWRVTPQVSWTSSDSNIVLYDYRRELYSVTVRRDF